MTDELLEELIAALKLCHQVLKDHVQYEEGEISLEGEAFRIAEKVLTKLGEIPCGS